LLEGEVLEKKQFVTESLFVRYCWRCHLCVLLFQPLNWP